MLIAYSITPELNKYETREASFAVISQRCLPPLLAIIAWKNAQNMTVPAQAAVTSQSSVFHIPLNQIRQYDLAKKNTVTNGIQIPKVMSLAYASVGGFSWFGVTPGGGLRAGVKDGRTVEVGVVEDISAGVLSTPL